MHGLEDAEQPRVVDLAEGASGHAALAVEDQRARDRGRRQLAAEGEDEGVVGVEHRRVGDVERGAGRPSRCRSSPCRRRRCRRTRRPSAWSRRRPSRACPPRRGTARTTRPTCSPRRPCRAGWPGRGACRRAWCRRRSGRRRARRAGAPWCCRRRRRSGWSRRSSRRSPSRPRARGPRAPPPRRPRYGAWLGSRGSLLGCGSGFGGSTYDGGPGFPGRRPTASHRRGRRSAQAPLAVAACLLWRTRSAEGSV